MSKQTGSLALEQWAEARARGKRISVIIMAGRERGQRRVVAFEHLGAAAPMTVDLEEHELTTVLPRLVRDAALLVDLVSYGAGPLPPPVPPPGPIGDDTLIAAELQALAAATVLARLVELRAQHDEARALDR